MHDFIKKHHWITCPYLHRLLIALVITLGAFGIWFGAEGALLDYWDEKIVDTYLSPLTRNWVLTTACILFTIFVIAVAIYRFIIRYQYRLSVACVFLVTAILLAHYRFHTILYIYVSPWNNCCFTYVDFLLVWLGLYIIASIANCISTFFIEEQTKAAPAIQAKAKRSEDNLLIPVLQSDNPISLMEEDELDYDKEVNKLTKEIADLNPAQSWSIAISAPWGAGKSSFMNMLRKSLSGKDFESFTFAPRNSKSAKNIQADFFNQLMALVGKIDIRIKNTMESYMELLGLIDNTGLLSKLTLSHIWKDEESKASLEEILEEYPKRIVVFIEDFDRLTRPEIIEVLKLIDNNAAFPNIIFITAYDKENVNAMLQRGGRRSNATPFADKFFNFEYVLPERPYTYVKKYLYGLLENMIDNEKHKAELAVMFDENKHYIDTYLQPCVATLRDAKRFYNMFATDYAHLQEDVIFKEFLFVELLKYHYPDVYHKLHSHEYLIEEDTVWSIKDNYHVDETAKMIMTDLFSIQKVNEYGEEMAPENPYRHIYDTAYFDNYFVNGVYGYLRVKDMRKTIDEGLELSKETIDNWFEDGIKETDYCLFMDSIIREDFTSKEQYFNYVDIYLYVVIHHQSKMLSWSDGNILQRQYAQWRLDKLGISEEEYKVHLLKSLNDVTLDPLMRAQRGLLEKEDIKDYYIERDEIYKVIKKQFFDILKDESIDEKDKFSYLLSRYDNTETVLLDADCCETYKQYIFSNPSWYIANFVDLADKFAPSDYNTITCRIFWKKIFLSESTMEEFIDDCYSKNLPGAECAKNFWRIYKANNFEGIRFEHQGNVRAKIDNNLMAEVEQLDELEAIKSEVNTLSLEIKKGNIDPRLLKLKIESLEKRLSNVQLYISLNGAIYTEIMKLKRLTQ